MKNKRTPQQTAQLILDRATPFFKRINGVAYSFYVANDKFDQEFNIFFESVPVSYNAKRTTRRRSQPIHTITDLEYLENTLNALSKLTKLTIDLDGFAGMVWPITGKQIQKINKNKPLTEDQIKHASII